MDEELQRAVAASLPEKTNRRQDTELVVIDLSSDDEDDDLDAPVHTKDSKSLKSPFQTDTGPKLDGRLLTNEESKAQGIDHHQVNGSSKLEKRAAPVFGSMSIEDEPKVQRESMKRKAAGQELRTDGLKRPRSTSLTSNEPHAASSSSTSMAKPSSSIATPVAPKIKIAYPDGALRITRTPGRRNDKNCVNLKDVVHKEHLLSACIFSFFIADEEFFPHFPLSHSSDDVPIYVGRDPNQDQTVHTALNQAGTAVYEKVTAKQLQSLEPALRQMNSQVHGKNFHSFYAWSSGSSHSKIMLLIYPWFLRIIITSCNMMNIDTENGDNHWYIHDLPRRFPRASEPLPFEADLLAHLQALQTPEAFLESIRGMYDYSTVKVHLITSVPGVQAGAKAEKHGLLRLRRIVRDLGLKLPKKESEGGELRLEVCAASIGNLSAKWLSGFNDCAVGMETISVTGDSFNVPDLNLFYPSVSDVRGAHGEAQHAASNIGCHTRPWSSAPEAIKKMFHHYQSKDTGRLFHQKLILAYNARDASAAPYYVYVGSANLSQSAWGALERDSSKKACEVTCRTKLVKMSNFECGVVVPGHLIEGLLEPGTRSWQDGIVPYVQSAERYDLRVDRAWNDPRWVQDYQEDYRGA